MGLTRPRAAQIYDIDYKQSVRVITTTNITLSGGAPTVVDGVTLSLNDRILVTGQSTASQNGIYIVSILGTGANGTWVRSSDTNATGELESGTIVMVTEGSTYADTSWKLTTNDPIVIGTTALTFEINTGNAFGTISANGTSVVSNSATGTVTFSTGNNIVITGNAASDTITFAVGDNPTFWGNVNPGANVTYDLGNTTSRWRDIWLANSTIYLGNAQISANATSVIITNPAGGTTVLSGASPAVNANTVTATGNITGGNLITSGILSVTGNANVGNLGTSGQITATGNITSAGNVNVGNAVFTTSNSAIQGWSYNSVNLSITATEGTPQGLFFGNSGASFYVVGSSTDRVYQYNMSTVNMANTGVLLGNVSVASQDTLPVDLYIDSTGANLYIMGGTNDTVYQYSMSTPWNITTATYTSRSFSVTTQEATPQGIWFKPDLTTMYVVGNTNDTVYQYSLSSAGNVATASYASKSFSVATQSGTPVAVQLSTDGSTMWILSQDQDAVFEYNLSTPWDVSTASYTAGRAFGFWAQGETGALGLFVDIGNSRAWMVGSTNDTIYQYDTLGSAILRGNAIGTQSSLTVGGNAYVAGRLQVDQAARFESSLTVDSTITATSTLSLTGTSTGTMSLGTSITTGAASIYTGQTTGVLLVGGTSATGDINIGRSTASQSIVIGNGVTASGSTKTIDIGTLGAANSITNINIGPVAGNSTVAFLANARVTIANALSVTGNANVGNLGATNANLTAITATGNANVGNLGTAGLIVATGNVTGGNLITAGLGSIGTTLSVTGNANVGNLGTAGLITATGAITGASINVPNAAQALTATPSVGFVLEPSFQPNYIGTQPFGSSMWVDKLRFIQPNTVETSTDGTTWTSTTDVTYTQKPFNGIVTQSTIPMNGTTLKGLRWTWSSNIQYSAAYWLGIAFQFATPAPTVTVQFETSTDGVSWTSRYTTSAITVSNEWVYIYTPENGYSVQYYRITLLQQTNTVNFNALQWYTARPGDQGSGQNNYFPFTYDFSKNVTFSNTATVTGNISAGNISTTGLLTATGNITGGNLRTSAVTIASTGAISGVTTISASGNANVGNLGATNANLTALTTSGNVTAGGISTAGNISAAFFLGNVACASGIFTTKIFSGTSEANIGVANGNANITIGGVSNVAVFSTVGANITGTLGVTGNVTGGNLITTGTVSTGTLTTSGNATIAGNLTVSGNVISVNVTDLNVVDPIIGLGRGANNTPLTSNDGKDRGEQLWYYTTSEQSAFIGYDNSAGKLIAATNVSVSSEVVTVNNYGNLIVGGLEATTISSTGNANVGNLGTAGQVTATGNVTAGGISTAGNVTAAFFLGNVSQASGIFTTKIFNGTSEANIGASGGNLAVSIGGTSNVVVVATTGIAVTGTSTVSGNANVGNLGTAGQITATGNITGGNLNVSGNIVDTGALFLITGASGNVTLAPNGTNVIIATTTGANITGTLNATGNSNVGNLGTTGQITATGNITGGNILGNGYNLTGINTFSSIAVTGANTVTADSIADTLTLVAGTGITIVTNDATDTITIATSSSGSEIFVDGADFGLVTEAVTLSQDLGLITVAVDAQTDLGEIVISGVFYPTQLVLPAYTVSTLPSATIPAQMIYVSNESGGAVPAFSDGTNWRRVTDRAIVS